MPSSIRANRGMAWPVAPALLVMMKARLPGNLAMEVTKRSTFTAGAHSYTGAAKQ